MFLSNTVPHYFSLYYYVQNLRLYLQYYSVKYSFLKLILCNEGRFVYGEPVKK